MTDAQIAYHITASAVCLSVAVLGAFMMLIGVALPRSSRTAGGRLWAAGVVMAIFGAGMYLVYAIVTIVTVVVSRT